MGVTVECREAAAHRRSTVWSGDPIMFIKSITAQGEMVGNINLVGSKDVDAKLRGFCEDVVAL